MGGRGRGSGAGSSSRSRSKGGGGNIQMEGIAGRTATVEFGNKKIEVTVTNLKTWSKGGNRRVYFDLKNDRGKTPVGFPDGGYIDSSKNARKGFFHHRVQVGNRSVVFNANGGSGSKREALNELANQLFEKRRKK